jgi:hypothetical protein
MPKSRKKNIKNIVRNVSCLINENINWSDYIRGYTYTFIHNIIICSIAFVGIFSSSWVHLTCLLIVVSLDALSIVVLHECPLTSLEKKYLGVSGSDNRTYILKKAGIMYKCNHNYEKQIELLVNVWCLIACKILIIIFFKTFHIKLNDDGNIYKFI